MSTGGVRENRFRDSEQQEKPAIWSLPVLKWQVKNLKAKANEFIESGALTIEPKIGGSIMNNYRVYPNFMLGVAVLAQFLCGTVFSKSPELPIRDHRAALEIANRFSGLDQLPKFTDVAITVQQVAIEEDYSHLYHKIERQPLWKVSYTNVVIRKDERLKPYPYISAFDVFVEVEAGAVLKIVSQWRSGIDPKYQERARRRGAYRKMGGTVRGEESITDIVPEKSPKLSFFEAYKKWIKKPSFESGIKNIEGFYVYYKQIRGGKEELQPVWFIVLHGGTSSPPPIKVPVEPQVVLPFKDSGNISLGSHAIIDAETGVILLSESIRH